MARPRRSGVPNATPGLFPGLDAEPQRAPARPRRSPRPTSSATRFAQVALNRPVRSEFTYGVPPELEEAVVPGVRVAVPFSGKREVGVVVGVSDDAAVDRERVLDLHRVLEGEAVVGEDLLELTHWMATEYACAWGQTLAAVLPAPLKREREARKLKVISAAPDLDDELLEELAEKWPKQHRLLRTLIDVGGAVPYLDLLRKTKLSDSPARKLVEKGLARVEFVEPDLEELAGDGKDRSRPTELSLGQRWAVKLVSERLETGEGETFLVQGVTGSGKTEVYLQAIEKALALGKGAIVLVPEIALTPQTVGWFRSRFGSVAVLHSRMTDTQRLRAWMRVKRGEARVVVGARSAIFAPVADLGVVVVDEEHEPSFKQGITPRYHARDVAVRRAAQANAVCLLGSATPSLESFLRAREGEYRFLKLPERIGGRPLPPVEIVDLEAERRTKSRAHSDIFSRRLDEALRETVAAGHQAILFLNRRGFTPVLWCRDCHETVVCEQCTSSMSYHRRIDRLVCHLCCEERRMPEACPVCTSPRLRTVGIGVERVEAALAEVVPEARVRRMDSDTMHRAEDYEEALAAFGRHELDVLVGTQMIAKGLDFPGVTLVGIVNADTSLHLPDFRAEERTFQLIEQVAGRAGRGDDPGRVIVQTASPNSPAVALAASHEYDEFAALQLEDRKLLGYPPFSRVVRVVYENEDVGRAEGAAKADAEALAASAIPGASVLGPSPAPLAFLRGRHRFHLMVKCADAQALARVRDRVVDLVGTGLKGTGGARATIDVDPVSVF